ncbi:hypothetical protein HU200_033195 [Digitaria exilis]|uniref:Uncharacterized protein n=1 Tax=Digitaria exilis TaxID=1010633 RepID=A0A835BJF3_9POAL|nr:hypothetical protein HU200_033195 [Digitaria exilis]
MEMLTGSVAAARWAAAHHGRGGVSKWYGAGCAAGEGGSQEADVAERRRKRLRWSSVYAERWQWAREKLSNSKWSSRSSSVFLYELKLRRRRAVLASRVGFAETLTNTSSLLARTLISLAMSTNLIGLEPGLRLLVPSSSSLAPAQNHAWLTMPRPETRTHGTSTRRAKLSPNRTVLSEQAACPLLRVPGYEGCPSYTYDVVDFVGELFVLGAACGSAFHFVKGLRASPSGSGARRLAGAARAVGANAPRVAGKFGAYCAAFSAIECAVTSGAPPPPPPPRGACTPCAVAGAAAASPPRRRPRRGGVPAAAGCALLGATGFLAVGGIDHAIMVWQSRCADEDSLRRQRQMMEPGRLLGFLTLATIALCTEAVEMLVVRVGRGREAPSDRWSAITTVFAIDMTVLLPHKHEQQHRPEEIDRCQMQQQRPASGWQATAPRMHASQSAPRQGGADGGVEGEPPLPSGKDWSTRSASTATRAFRLASLPRKKASRLWRCQEGPLQLPQGLPVAVASGAQEGGALDVEVVGVPGHVVERVEAGELAEGALEGRGAEPPGAEAQRLGDRAEQPEGEAEPHGLLADAHRRSGGLTRLGAAPGGQARRRVPHGGGQAHHAPRHRGQPGGPSSLRPRRRPAGRPGPAPGSQGSRRGRVRPRRRVPRPSVGRRAAARPSTSPRDPDLKGLVNSRDDLDSALGFEKDSTSLVYDALLPLLLL